MASKISINLDTSKEFFLNSKCKQNDDLILEANIYENGLAKDLTNCSISIQALKADKTYIIQNTDITKKNNKFIANLVRDFTRIAGKTEIEIVLTESSKQNTTFSFCIEVVGSVIRGAVQSSNTVTILENLQDKIEEAGQVKAETEQLIEKGGAATKGDIEKVNSSLEQKTDKIYVDTKIGNMGNTKTFKGSCLYSALPTGATVDDYWYVTDKNTNYCWNGSSWIDIGNSLKVGENAVLSENILAEQIVKEKTNFFNYYENILNPTPIYTDKAWYWSISTNSLTTMEVSGHTCYQRVKLYGGITYSFKDIRGGSVLVSLDLKTKIGELSTSGVFTGSYTPVKDCWLYPHYYSATNMTNIMIVNSSEYWCIGNNIKLEYGKKYKRTIGDINLDNILNDIIDINKKIPNKLSVQAMYEELYNYIDLKYKINWVVASFKNQGGYIASNVRICTSSMQYADTDIILSTDYSKYRISVYIYDKKDNPTIIGNSGWITQGTYTIPKGTYYMLQSSSLDESEVFQEVYNDCFNSIKFKTSENLEEKLNNLSNIKVESNVKPLLFNLSPMKTRVIMHRGYSNKAPDNSIASFTLAGQTQECWGIETDARVLTDDTIVCFHDTELDSHTTGTGAILDKSYIDIQDVKYDSGVNGLSQYPNEKISLFSDYLKICRKYGKVAVIDLKPLRRIEDIDKIVNMVNSYNMRNSAIYISFDKAYIDRVLEVDSKAVVQKLYLVNDNIDYDNFNYDSIGLEIESWGQTDNNIIESNIRKLQSRGILVSTWTTDTSSTKRSLENKCVDFITTNLIN